MHIFNLHNSQNSQWTFAKGHHLFCAHLREKIVLLPVRRLDIFTQIGADNMVGI
jgi:hypothetical protein